MIVFGVPEAYRDRTGNYDVAFTPRKPHFLSRLYCTLDTGKSGTTNGKFIWKLDFSVGNGYCHWFTKDLLSFYFCPFSSSHTRWWSHRCRELSSNNSHIVSRANSSCLFPLLHYLLHVASGMAQKEYKKERNHGSKKKESKYASTLTYLIHSILFINLFFIPT